MDVWCLETGEHVHELQGHDNDITHCCLTPDGRHVVSSSKDATIRVWFVLDGRQTSCFISSLANCVCVTPDGQHIVSGGPRKVCVYDFDGHVLFSLRGHTRHITRVCVSPDGEYIVSCGYDKTVRVWSYRDRVQLHCMTGHTQGVLDVCCTPDSRHVVSGSYDYTVRVWSLQTGQQVDCLEGHTWPVRSVQVTCDGQHIVSADDRVIVRVWHLVEAQLQHEVDNLYATYTLCVDTANDGDAFADKDDLFTNMLGVVVQDTMLRLRSCRAATPSPSS